ncbi:unnamed protein product, partial [Owenia fusiformis]
TTIEKAEPSRPPIIMSDEFHMTGLSMKTSGDFKKELEKQASEMFKTLAKDVIKFLVDESHNGGLNKSGELRNCSVTKFRNGSIIAEFDLIYDVQKALLDKSDGVQGLKKRVRETMLVMGNKKIKTDAFGPPQKELSVDETYIKQTTLQQIENVTVCNNPGNTFQCEYGHRCLDQRESNSERGVPVCYSLCSNTPYGIWGGCSDGTCSLGALGNTTVCKCNDGYYLQRGECKSYVQIVAIVGGSLGGAVLILIIILIVCAANKRSPPVPKTIPPELYDIDDGPKLKPSIKAPGQPLSESPQREQSDPQIREGPNEYSDEPKPRDDRYKDERYRDERNQNGRNRDERNQDKRFRDDRNRDERYREDSRDQGPSRSNDPTVWPVFSYQQDESNLEKRIVSDRDRMPPRRTESWLKQGEQPVRPLSPEEEARFDLASSKPNRSFYDDYKSPNQRDDPSRRPYERERDGRDLYDNRHPYEREVSRGYDNKGYSNDEYIKDSRADGQGDIFPRLDGIDTNKDYSIKRPTFSLSAGRL